MFKKLKQRWIWATHYKAMFATVDRTFILEHRIGRAPKMTSTKTGDTLRGQHATMVIFDEVQFQSDLDDFELPKTNVVYKKENR